MMMDCMCDLDGLYMIERIFSQKQYLSTALEAKSRRARASGHFRLVDRRSAENTGNTLSDFAEVNATTQPEPRRHSFHTHSV